MSEVYEYLVGRSQDCHLVLKHPLISRKHARVCWDGEEWGLQDLGSANGTFLNDAEEPISFGSKRILNQGDIVYFSRHYKLPADLLIKRVCDDARESSSGDISVFDSSKELIRIGRSSDNDIVLPQLSVSRFHAEIYIRPDGSRELKDLGSVGGTFVNDRQIVGEAVMISMDDEIEVGGVSVAIQFSDKPGEKTMVGGQREGIYLKVDRLGLEVQDRQTARPKHLLKELSLSIFPGEFVGLMGPSGCGKTTFMTGVNGCVPFTTGSVYYNGVELAANLARFSPQIGYVPQDDIMHPELSVREVLFFTAKLKLANDVRDDDIHAKIDSVCRDLNLLEVAETLIGTPEQKTLSGGQKKRVNLAMELLTDPKILFLDEPTSGLSSADTINVMNLLRAITDQRGIAIMITIHQPSSNIYRLMDKVIYLKGGRLCYFGSTYPDSIQYFVKDKDPQESGPDEVMEKLDVGNEQRMEAQYRNSNEYRELVERRALLLDSKTVVVKSFNSPPVSSLLQFLTLLKRYATCKTRDRGALAILVAKAPLIGGLVGWIFREGTLNAPLFLLIFISLWFGTNNSAKELVGERSIFRREKRSGLSILGYLGSKLLVQSILTLVQCSLLVFVSTSFLDVAFPLFVGIGICWLTSLVGIAIGLSISAWSRTEVTAIVSVPLILIPFILFGGLLKPYHDMGSFSQVVANLNPARWGYEAIVQLERGGHEEYARSPKKMIRDLTEALKAVESGAPTPNFIGNKKISSLQAFDETEDLKKDHDGSDYCLSRILFAIFVLNVMTLLIMLGSLYRVCKER